MKSTFLLSLTQDIWAQVSRQHTKKTGVFSIFAIRKTSTFIAVHSADLLDSFG